MADSKSRVGNKQSRAVTTTTTDVVESSSVEAVKRLLSTREGDAKQRHIIRHDPVAPVRRTPILMAPMFKLGGKRSVSVTDPAIKSKPVFVAMQPLPPPPPPAPSASSRRVSERGAGETKEESYRDTDTADPDEAVKERRAKRPRMEEEDDDDGPDYVEGTRPGVQTDSDDDDNDDDEDGEESSDGDVTNISIGLPLPPPLPSDAFTAVDDIQTEKKHHRRALKSDDVALIDFNARERAMSQNQNKRKRDWL
jgi:hypothetical protein